MLSKRVFTQPFLDFLRRIRLVNETSPAVILERAGQQQPTLVIVTSQVGPVVRSNRGDFVFVGRILDEGGEFHDVVPWTASALEA